MTTLHRFIIVVAIALLVSEVALIVDSLADGGLAVTATRGGRLGIAGVLTLAMVGVALLSGAARARGRDVGRGTLCEGCGNTVLDHWSTCPYCGRPLSHVGVPDGALDA